MNKKDELTRKQKQLIKELDDIYSRLRLLDYKNIQKHPREDRTTVLGLIKNQIIRSEVIMDYTLIDEYLNNMLCRYFFPKKDFMYLWRTKKFQNFNYHILERLPLLQKLRFLKNIRKIPKQIADDIETINSLRNALAHAFFPENLKRYKKKRKVIYKDKDIFTLEGIQQFLDDVTRINAFFVSKF